MDKRRMTTGEFEQVVGLLELAARAAIPAMVADFRQRLERELERDENRPGRDDAEYRERIRLAAAHALRRVRDR